MPLDQAAQIKANPAVVAKTNPYGGRTEITFNSTIPPFDKKAMRAGRRQRAGARGDAGRHRAQGSLTLNSSPFFPNQTTWFSKIGYETYITRDLKKARELITSAPA